MVLWPGQTAGINPMESRCRTHRATRLRPHVRTVGTARSTPPVLGSLFADGRRRQDVSSTSTSVCSPATPGSVRRNDRPMTRLSCSSVLVSSRGQKAGGEVLVRLLDAGGEVDGVADRGQRRRVAPQRADDRRAAVEPDVDVDGMPVELVQLAAAALGRHEHLDPARAARRPDGGPSSEQKRAMTPSPM